MVSTDSMFVLQLLIWLLQLPKSVGVTDGNWSYTEKSCKVPCEVHADDYRIVSNETESGLQCAIVSRHQDCERFIFRMSTKMCVCLYTSTTPKRNPTFVDDLVAKLDDVMDKTEYYVANITAPYAKNCGIYKWIPKLKVCIRIVETKMNYIAAEGQCQEDNDRLIVSSTEDKMSDLSRYLVENGYSSQYWIGLNRMSTSSYMWIDNTPVVFSQWGVNEPTGRTDEHCVRLMFHGDRFKWYDNSCDSGYYMICELAY